MTAEVTGEHHDAGAHPAPPAQERAQGSRVRHDGRPEQRQAHGRARGTDLVFLLGALPRAVWRRACQVSRGRGPDARAGAGRQHLHLPHASARFAKSVPASARSAAWRSSRADVEADSGPQPRARRHDAPVLDRPPAHAAGPGPGNGWASEPICTCCPASSSATGCNSCWRRPVVLWAGWPFFVRGWASLKTRQPQHVHPDRHGHRRSLDL